MNSEKGFRFFNLLFMEWKEILSAATFERARAVRLVRQKIFQRGKQERAELTFLPVDPSVNFMFQQMCEKALREILCIVHGVSTPAHETVKWRPIGSAK